MSNNPVKDAMQLIEQGQIEQGAPILINLLEYKRPADAWEWLCSWVKTDAQKLYCIKRILEINPRDQKAQNALVKMKLKEAKSIGQIDIQEVDETRTNHLVEQEPVAIPIGHEEISSHGNSDTQPITEQKTNHQYRQELLPEFEELESSGQIVISKADISILRKKRLKLKSKHKRRIKKRSSTKRIKETEKPTEPTIFDNPKMYGTLICTKPGENMFAETNSYSGFPQTDSGMYGRRLVIGGVPITSFDYPHCIEIQRIPHKSYCHDCEFFSIRDCPIRRDVTILKDAITLFAHNKRYAQAFKERSQVIIETIFTELKAHGRPLHYEVVFRILHDRHPNLKLNSRKVLQLMHWHPEKFERVDAGVYCAK
jgi:hypothetical protein